jgi:hypothetical protein
LAITLIVLSLALNVTLKNVGSNGINADRQRELEKVNKQTGPATTTPPPATQQKGK